MKFEDVLFSVFRRLSHMRSMQRPLDLALTPFNPFAPERFTNPYPLYEKARREEPVYFNRLAQTWIVTGYQETAEILRSPVSVDRRRTFEPLAPYKKMKQANIDLLFSNMLMSDNPDHGRLRNLVSRAFTPRAISGMQPKVEELAADLLSEMSRQSRVGELGNTAPQVTPTTVDLMDGLANRLPIYVIGELLGIPRDLWPDLKRLSDTVARFVDPFNLFDPAEMDAAVDELRVMLSALADQRAAAPRSDLITALVQTEADGERLNRDELISMILVLMIAGHETTSSFIGNAVLALGRNPSARQMLLDRPDLTGNAIEELLRFDSPIQATDRTVVAPLEVGGKTIKTGSLILVLLGAANHDPTRYDQPGRLQLDRPEPRPLSFGHGIHHCIGAALARMEAAVAVPAFVRAFPHYRVDESALTWKRSTTFRGPRQMLVDLQGTPETTATSRPPEPVGG